MIQVDILSQSYMKVKTDLTVVTFFKDIVPLKGYVGDIDWLLNTQISSLIKNEKIFGTYKETTLLNSKHKLPADKILVFGLGKSTSMSPSKIIHAYTEVARAILKIKIYDFSLGIFQRELSSSNYLTTVVHMMEGVFTELAAAQPTENFSIKIVEENSSKIILLRKAVRQSVQKCKKRGCKIQVN